MVPLLVLSLLKRRVTRDAAVLAHFLVAIIGELEHYMSLLFLAVLNYDSFLLSIRKAGTERELSLASGFKKKKKKKDLGNSHFYIQSLSIQKF